jgi:two-component sensor histidine kinase
MKERQTSILVIDDERDLREANGLLLGRSGYKVLLAGTAVEGMALARAEKPDIILLDINLPDGNGYDICERLNLELVNKGTLIVLASGLDNGPDDRTRGFDMGADEFIARPIGNKELLARIKALERISKERLSLRESSENLELLVRQTHNRIKNDLFVIESLIRMREEGVSDPATITLLDDLVTRVRAISGLHESLARSEELARVDARTYLQGILDGIASISLERSRDLRLDSSLESVEIDPTDAVSLGMIVSELVGNATRHGFPAGTHGVISVTLRRADGCLEVLVEDDGKGLPADFEFGKASHLGLRLVATLVANLRGRIDTLPGPGARFLIRLDAETDCRA